MRWRAKLQAAAVLFVLLGIPLFLVFGLYIPDEWWMWLFHR